MEYEGKAEAERIRVAAAERAAKQVGEERSRETEERHKMEDEIRKHEVKTNEGDHEQVIPCLDETLNLLQDPSGC